MQENATDRRTVQAFLRSWLEALKLSWNSAWRVDRSQLTAQTAVRGLIGFVLPLALGVATGHVVEGVSIAGGSSLLAVVGINMYRVRLRVLFLCCVSIAVGAFIGSVTSSIPLLAILAAGVMGFGAGLLVAISVPISIVGIESIIALIVLSHFALTPLMAFLQAALLFAGALLQLVLEVLLSPWHRTDAERQSLSLTFERLAEVASTLSYEDPEMNREALQQGASDLRIALAQSQEIILDSNDRSLQGKAFFALYNGVEQMRLLVIVLRQLKQRLLENASRSSEGMLALNQLLQELAAELQRVSRQMVLSGREFRKERRSNQSNEKIKSIISRLEHWQTSSPEQQEILDGLIAYSHRIAYILYRVKRLAMTWRRPDTRLLAAYTIHRRSAWMEVHNAQEILRANLTLRSTACRHAIRLGVTLALATILYHIPSFPLGRGYWIPLTAFIVLKPDFNTTFARGVARMLGTLGGVVLATLLIVTLRPSLITLVIIDAIVAYISFSILFVNYALFSVFVTVEVVFLLAFVTPQPLSNVFDRGADTILGGLLALFMFLIWPTWERSQVYHNIATRLEAVRHYFMAIMEAYIYPSTYNPDFMNHLRRESRLASSNALTSVERTIQESTLYRFNPSQLRGILDAINSIGFSLLTLEAYHVNNFVLAPDLRYPLDLFCKEINQALQQLAQAISNKQSVTIAQDDIHAALQALEDAEKRRQAKQSPHSLSPIENTFLLEEAEQIVRNVDIISKLVPVPEQPRQLITSNRKG